MSDTPDGAATGSANVLEEDRVSAGAKRSSQLAYRAGQAYLDGDMATAARLYEESGDVMAGLVAGAEKPAQRDFVRILAIAQYYKGGHFQKAQRLLDRVRPDRNKAEVKAAFESFRKGLQERASKNYRNNVARRVNACSKARKYEQALLVLNEHPWALPPEETIRLRLTFGALAGLVSPDELARVGMPAEAVAEEVPEEAPQDAEPYETTAVLGAEPGGVGKEADDGDEEAEGPG